MSGPSDAARSGGELQYHHIAIAFLAVIAAFFMIEPIYRSLFPIYLTYNEGWNANHAHRAMLGQNLYADANPLSANNYPPLSFYIVGGLGKLFGDYILAGRIIAFLAFFTTAANIFVIVRKICHDRPAAVFSGVFFVAMMAGIYDVYVGISDPQMLGHAFMTTGLAFLVGSETKRRNLVLSAFFICAGGFVKHNLVALPAATALFLLICHRKAFFFWMASFVGFVAVAFAATLAIFGFEFFDALNSPRRFTLFRLGKKMLSEPLRLQLPIVFWLLYTAFTFKEKYTLLLGAYILISASTAVIFSGGDGVHFNVFFDLVIGLSIAIGLLVHRANEQLKQSAYNKTSQLVLMTVLSLAVCFGIVIHVPLKAYSLSKIIPELPTIESETFTDIEYLEGLPGPIFCESLALCFRAGKPVEVDSFYARQLFLSGRESEEMLLKKVRSGYYDAIQLGVWELGRDDERMSSSFIQTVRRCYEIDRVSANGAFFAPRRGACLPEASPDAA